MNMKNWRDKVKMIMLIMFVSALIPIFWIGCYNHPTADDYNFSSESGTWEIAHNGGSIFEVVGASWNNMVGMYYSWEGTYSAFLLTPMQPGIYGTHEEFYKITTAIIVVNLVIAVFYFISKLGEYLSIDYKKINFISIPIILSIIEGFPSPVQGLFWYTGSITYMFFWTWMMMGTGIMLSMLCDEQAKWWKVVISMAIAFWVSGGNHVSAFANVLLTLGFFVYSVIRKKWNKVLPFGLICLSAVTGFMINALAPGTQVRASLLNKQPISTTIVKCAIVGVDELMQWIKGPQVCLLILIGLFLIGHIVTDTNLGRFKFRYLFIMMVLCYGLYCAMLCVAYYPMGNFGVGRMRDIRYSTAIIMYVLIFIYLCGCIEALCKKINIHLFENMSEMLDTKVRNRTAILISFILMVVITLYTGSIGGNVTYQSIKQIVSGEAKGYCELRDNSIGHDVDNPEYKPSMIYYSTVDPEIDS